jgi:hypothetical protein
MGQYHMLVNYDKREFVHPHNIGLGLKQWEHIGFEGGTLSDALYILTMTSPRRGGGDLPETSVSGRWAGDRCFVLGDYTEDDDLPEEMKGGTLYESALRDYENISSLVAQEMGKVFDFTIIDDEEGYGYAERTYAKDQELV